MEQGLTGNYESDLALLKAQSNAGRSEDVMIREFQALGRRGALLYVDGLADCRETERFLLQPLQNAPLPGRGYEIADYVRDCVLPLAALSPVPRAGDAVDRAFRGNAVVILEGMPGALAADVKGFSHRAVSEPINESVVMGPHEGFNESLRDNTALVRRLLPSPQLISERMTVGNRIKTGLCMLYLSGVAREESIAQARRRIQGCNIDYVSSLGALEQLIEDRPFALTPQCLQTERPDRAVSFLNEGQIVILMDNAPAALAVPITFFHLFHAPDDTALRWPYGTFLRLLRLAGMLIALLLPGIFICLTSFHPEGMSLALLTSIMESQERVPFSLFASTLIMLLIFSLLSEAGARVPGAMGSSVSIVGGLILGQAAVQADLISPLVIIVVALAGLGNYAVPVYSLALGLRIAQLFLALLSGAAGFPGLTMGVFLLLVRLCGLTSLNVPFFSPVAPRRIANPDQVRRAPIWRQRLRGLLAQADAQARAWGPMRAWDRKEEK